MTRPNSAAISRPLFQVESLSPSSKKRPFELVRFAPRGPTESDALLGRVLHGEFAKWYLDAVGTPPAHVLAQVSIAIKIHRDWIRRMVSFDEAGRTITPKDRLWSVWGTSPTVAVSSPTVAKAGVPVRAASITGSAVRRGGAR